MADERQPPAAGPTKRRCDEDSCDRRKQPRHGEDVNVLPSSPAADGLAGFPSGSSTRVPRELADAVPVRGETDEETENLSYDSCLQPVLEGGQLEGGQLEGGQQGPSELSPPTSASLPGTFLPETFDNSGMLVGERETGTVAPLPGGTPWGGR